MKGPHGRRVTVPVHGSTTLPVGTTAGIIEQTGISVEEFIALL